ncbi:MAG TPA: low specificity L-threonine aldolase [Ohtaekwangia sp.]|nr:low specificity L-threonine aldolase [Ohtaekwangia sp.]
MNHRSFASDNYSGVHPEVMEALISANQGHAPSYGADEFTQKAKEKFKAIFGKDTAIFFVYNGTGANVLGLSTITQSFNAILCSELAHINVDESTAPEKFTGCKIMTVPQSSGKITAEQVNERIQRVDDQHHPQLKVISISQTTEYATVYSVEEIKAIAAVAKQHGLYLHMDGARIANAAAGLKKHLREITVDAGVDVLSFGGTKNGMMFGEAVLFFNPHLARHVKFIRKQEMQLHSKMRFIGAQFDALLSNDLWYRNATHANAMGEMLKQEIVQIPGVTITHPVDANGVFAILPKQVTEQLQQQFPFYVWNEKRGEVRLMCSFDTTPEDIRSFGSALRNLMQPGQISA